MEAFPRFSGRVAFHDEVTKDHDVLNVRVVKVSESIIEELVDLLGFGWCPVKVSEKPDAGAVRRGHVGG